MKNRGVLVTLEGIDGSGKSTHLRLLAKRLGELGYSVRVTREPGGTRVGEQIREIVLENPARARGRATRAGNALRLSPLAELALMYAARAQHLEHVVRPALARGHVVLSDRFNDASLAYQGYGRKLGVRTVRALDRIICGPTEPDLTIILDLPARIGLRRARQRGARKGAAQSRFEHEALGFHERVRKGYLAIARREPSRVKVVRAHQPVAEVQRHIRQIVERWLARRRKPKR